jgi:hypothetical protein
MRPKLTNCTPDDLVALFRRLGGFSIKEGGKHTKITHIKTGKATIIARHSRVDPNIAKSIIYGFIIRDLGYDTEKVYTNLKC